GNVGVIFHAVPPIEPFCWSRRRYGGMSRLSVAGCDSSAGDAASLGLFLLPGGRPRFFVAGPVSTMATVASCSCAAYAALRASADSSALKGMTVLLSCSVSFLIRV